MKFDERFESDFSFSEMQEKATDQKRMRVIATVQEADKINKNGRLYPKKILDSAVKAFQSKLEKRAFGEVDHPIAKGKLKDTSHIISKLFWDSANDKMLNAEMIILNSPSGKVLKEIIRAGGKPGLSSRGQGKSTRQKINGREAEIIEPGFKFNSFDFVIDPSVSSAKIKRVFESANGEDIKLLEQIHKRAQGAAGIKQEDIKSQKTTDSFHAKLKAIAGIESK